MRVIYTVYHALFCRLVELLTSREKMRECIQYLQSLRAIVDNPPVTPTRTLAKTKAPSIDKVVRACLLDVYIACIAF